MANHRTPTSTPASPTPAPLFTQEKCEQNYEATQQRCKLRPMANLAGTLRYFCESML